MQISMYIRENDVYYQANNHKNNVAFQQAEKSLTAQSADVTISTSAQALYEKESAQPEIGTSPSIDQNIKETAKAIAAYRAVANLMDDSISLGEAYLIKHNDTARQFYVGKNQLNHQANMAEAYLNNINDNSESENSN